MTSARIYNISLLSSVHLKIHIPKIIKKHTHVQTIYKVRKMPVLETNSEEEDEHKDGSEKYIRLDSKIFSGSGNELRSMKWRPRYVYQRVPRGAFSSSTALALKRYPKNVKVIHEFEHIKDYPRKVKSHRIIKHQLVPTYDEDLDDDLDHNEGQEDYAESNPVKSYLRQPSTSSQNSSPIKFIPASEVSQYIPTIPYSALKNQFNPLWTPTGLNLAKNKDPQRLGRSSRYEGSTTMRVFSNGASDYSSPIHMDRFRPSY